MAEKESPNISEEQVVEESVDPASVQNKQKADPSVDPQSEGAPEPVDVTELIQNLKTAQTVATQHEDAVKTAKDQALRAMAELENYKRRKQQEFDNFKKYAAESVVMELLPVLDNFERSFTHVPEFNESQKEWANGFQLIYRQLSEALKKMGVESFESENQPFDPNKHQAVSQGEKDGVDSNVVLTEVQKGYALNGKVIRPAMVVVSK